MPATAWKRIMCFRIRIQKRRPRMFHSHSSCKERSRYEEAEFTCFYFWEIHYYQRKRGISGHSRNNGDSFAAGIWCYSWWICRGCHVGGKRYGECVYCGAWPLEREEYWRTTCCI